MKLTLSSPIANGDMVNVWFASALIPGDVTVTNNSTKACGIVCAQTPAGNTDTDQRPTAVIRFFDNAGNTEVLSMRMGDADNSPADAHGGSTTYATKR